MNNYIRQQSVSEILRNAATIYKSHFGFFLRIYVLPMIAFYSIIQLLPVENPLWLLIPNIIATITIVGASTIAISHICLSNQPSIRLSWQHMRKRLPRLIRTDLLLTGLALIPLALQYLLDFSNTSVTNTAWFLFLAVFMLIFIATTLFAFSAAALEPLFDFAAIKRSIRLAQGYYLRNFFILLTLLSPILLCLTPVVFLEQLLAPQILKLISFVILYIMAPLCFVGIVLMYWDLRVRKEAYDSSVLAEEIAD